MLSKKFCHHLKQANVLLKLQKTLIIWVQNKVIKENSIFANSLVDKSISKQKNNKKMVGIILILNYVYNNHYKTCWHIV